MNSVLPNVPKPPWSRRLHERRLKTGSEHVQRPSKSETLRGSTLKNSCFFVRKIKQEKQNKTCPRRWADLNKLVGCCILQPAHPAKGEPSAGFRRVDLQPLVVSAFCTWLAEPSADFRWISVEQFGERGRERRKREREREREGEREGERGRGRARERERRGRKKKSKKQNEREREKGKRRMLQIILRTF